MSLIVGEHKLFHVETKLTAKLHQNGLEKLSEKKVCLEGGSTTTPHPLTGVDGPINKPKF